MTMADEARAVESYLHEHIPISRAIGIRVTRADLAVVELSAPLGPNLNHRSTVFGGSSASVAILAAWALLHLHVTHIGGLYRVVIRRAEIDYDDPITGTFLARCDSPGDAFWSRFAATLQRRGMARATLRTAVTCSGRQVGSFIGGYAVVRKDEPDLTDADASGER